MPGTTIPFYVRLLTGALLTLFFSCMLIYFPAPTTLIESKLYDLRMKMRPTQPPPTDIVIAAIDDKSIEKLGRWPWNRDIIARLVDRLAEADASVIAFDIIFSEKERNDPLLAKSIDNAGNVILPIVFDFAGKDRPATAAATEQAALSSVTHPDRFSRYQPITAKGQLAPVPQLTGKAAGLGHINMFPDRDGTLRWEALLIAFEDLLYPSLPLSVAARHMGIDTANINVDAARSIAVARSVIPTDEWGRTLINYYGPSQTFIHYPISDIINGQVKPEKLANKIVLIGATAVGIYDLRVTPYSPAMPGIEKHAAVVASILDNRFITRASDRLNLAVLIFSGLLLSALLAKMNVVKASMATAICLGIVVCTAFWIFSAHGLWINLTCPAANLIGIFTTVTAYNYWAEERFSRDIRRMFSNYVTARVVNELIKNPQMAKLGGERRVVTVLFSDIKGFTTFSEKHSPTEVVSVLNEYLGAMTEIIFKWEGTLDKFVGDEIMAFWGAPLIQDDHAERAVMCAMDMRSRLDELQRKWLSEGRPALDAGIGINSGEMLVGNIGAEGKKMDYTVIGDHVNLGARVEALTRKYEKPVVITAHTFAMLPAQFMEDQTESLHFEWLEEVTVKGKEQAVGLYAVNTLPGNS